MQTCIRTRIYNTDFSNCSALNGGAIYNSVAGGLENFHIGKLLFGRKIDINVANVVKLPACICKSISASKYTSNTFIDDNLNKKN